MQGISQLEVYLMCIVLWLTFDVTLKWLTWTNYVTTSAKTTGSLYLMERLSVNGHYEYFVIVIQFKEIRHETHILMW